jgi:hypothetical protein
VRNAYKILEGNPERNSPLRKPKLRSENNFKMCLKEIGYDDLD